MPVTLRLCHPVPLAVVLFAAACGSPDAGLQSSRIGTSRAIASPADDSSSSGLTATEVGPCEQVTVSARLDRRPADIIWVIDNSASMFDETAAVERHMNRFSRRIAESGVDARVVVISACSGGLDTNGVTIAPPLGSGDECPGDASPPEYVRVVHRVSSDQVLEAVVDTYPEWASAMRPDATKTFVVVTDDDSRLTAEQFSREVEALDPMFAGADWVLSGIFCAGPCPPAPGQAGYDRCGAPGATYLDLVDARGGVFGDLCREDFEPVFDQLAEGVVRSSPIACGLAVPSPPDGAKLDPERVNVRYVPPEGDAGGIAVGAMTGPAECDEELGGWYYADPSHPDELRLCRASCEAVNRAVGTRLEVGFGCMRRGLR